MILKEDRNKLRAKRHLRIRKKVKGTPDRPRLCVFKSLKHIYAQIIDDTQGKTLVHVSTLTPELRGQVKGCNIKSARAVGELLAKKALEKGINKVVFDRGGYIYHGKVKELAEAARNAGLEF